MGKLAKCIKRFEMERDARKTRVTQLCTVDDFISMSDDDKLEFVRLCLLEGEPEEKDV